MRWNWQRLRDDPNIVPMRVRLFGAGHWMAGGMVIAWLQPTFWGGAAYSGILFGMCGAAVLWWETNLESHEVTQLANVIMGAGQSRNLNRSERRAVVITGLMGLGSVALGAAAAFILYQRSSLGWSSAMQISWPLAVSILGPTIYYIAVKRLKAWAYEQSDILRKLQLDERKDLFRRYLRLLGFALIWISGLLQIPELLSRFH